MPKFIRFSNQIIKIDNIKRIFMCDFSNEVRLLDNDGVVYSIHCSFKSEMLSVFQSYLNILATSKEPDEIGRVTIEKLE